MTYPSFVAQLAPPAVCASATTTPLNGTTTAAADENVTEAERAAVVVAAAQEETTPLALVAYAVRFLACWVTMELVLHTMYVVALKDSGKGWWNGMTPAQVSLVGFWNLIVVWLKVSRVSPLFSSVLCAIKSDPAMLSCSRTQRCAAPPPVAVVPPLVPPRRDRAPREHDPLHGQQLFRPRVLARLAPQLQPLGRPVFVHPPRRIEQTPPRDVGGVHVRRAVARFEVEVVGVGVGDHVVCCARDGRTETRPVLKGEHLRLSSFPCFF